MASRRRTVRPPDSDHRTRVGRQRRARTQKRILQAALEVFARKGPDAPVIDDFIKAAGVARGTFYNHFGTTGELLTATSKWLEDELMRAIEVAIARLDDPVERLATGLRLWLHQSRNDAVFCAFVVRNPFRGRLVERRLAKDLGDGLRSGQFAAPSVRVARDFVVGTAREAQVRMMNGRVATRYPDDVARVVLRGLRVNERTVNRLLAAPLPSIERSNTRDGTA